MDLDKQKTIKELKQLAEEIIEIKKDNTLRRPLLIEFCGSPKSGKSTTITSLNQFLKRSGFETKVLTEKASICPISNKKDPFFNIWTLSSAIAEILETIDKRNVDIIIADRAIFDALCWFEWLSTNESLEFPYLKSEDYTALKGFINMDLIKDYIDIVYVFKASPEISIEREYANLLTEERGSIMQEPVLESFAVAIDQVIKDNNGSFKKVITIDTSSPENNKFPNIVSYKVTKRILEALKMIVIEKVGFVPKNNLISNGLVSGINEFDDIIKTEKLDYEDRDSIERSHSKMQLIPIAVITNKERNKVLVVKKSEKREKSDSPEKNKTLLYSGGHIRKEDDKGNTLETIKQTLYREIKEELGESINVNGLSPFLIYTPNFSEKSEHHLAVCFVIEMDFSSKKFKTVSDELIRKTGTSISGHTLSIKEILLKESQNLESWSLEILKEVFNVTNKFSGKELKEFHKIEKDFNQPRLFDK